MKGYGWFWRSNRVAEGYLPSSPTQSRKREAGLNISGIYSNEIQQLSFKLGFALLYPAYGPPNIPLFVAGYTGWNQMQTVQQKLQSAPQIDGILIIDAGIFVSSPQFRSVQVQGPVALWALICCLHMATSGLRAASTNPVAYVT